MSLKLISKNSIEQISKIIGDAKTGSEITSMLSKIGFPAENFLDGGTKWRRLDSLFNQYQDKFKSPNYLIKTVESFIDPVNYISDQNTFQELRDQLNQILSFEGLFISENGKISKVNPTTTLREAKNISQSLKTKLQSQNIHEIIIRFCQPDILNEDYHSIIFESSKSLFEMIRDKAGINLDGNSLVVECFNSESPILVFNKLQTATEKDEYNGFRNFLFSIGKMFRNPRAHIPKIYSIDNEQDCIQILHLITFALNKVASCQVNEFARGQSKHQI